MKTQNKQKKKENKWKTGTLILIGVIGILLINGVYLAQKESDNNRLDFREKNSCLGNESTRNFCLWLSRF